MNKIEKLYVTLTKTLENYALRSYQKYHSLENYCLYLKYMNE